MTTADDPSAFGSGPVGVVAWPSLNWIAMTSSPTFPIVDTARCLFGGHHCFAVLTHRKSSTCLTV
jgi:hypothetical protein